LLLPDFEDIMVKAKNWSTYISEESKARENSPLKALANYLTIPGLISLGGGYSVSPSL
jgi:aromatic amino acid aminotransferase I